MAKKQYYCAIHGSSRPVVHWWVTLLPRTMVTSREVSGHELGNPAPWDTAATFRAVADYAEREGWTVGRVETLGCAADGAGHVHWTAVVVLEKDA